TTPARSRSRKLSNTARSRLKNTLIRPKPLDQLSTTCGQAQNGGGSGSGWLWWVRRCWNSFHVVVKVWTSQGVMRSHSSRVCRGGLLRIVQVDRKSTRLNSSHVSSSYSVFCLKK